MKKIPTIENIRDGILSDIKNKLYTNEAGIPMLKRSVWVIIATAFAAVIRSSYEFTRYSYRQIFTSTSDINSLIFKGEQYGIYKKRGTYSQIEIEFTGESGSIIDVNTQLISNDYIYVVINPYDINSNGKANIIANATVVGSFTSLPIGSQVAMVSPISGVSEIGKIIKNIVAGENEESIEDYRKRIQKFEQARPQGGAIPDFVNWTLEVPGITKAFVQTPKIDNRTVTVYPLTDGSSGSRIPNDVKIAEVLAYLTDPVRLPPCNVTVKKAKEIAVNVVVVGLSPNTESMKSLVASAWEKMLFRKYPIQYSYENNANNLISSSIFSSEALLAGAKGLDTKITISTGGGTPYALAIGEIVKLGSISWA